MRFFVLPEGHNLPLVGWVASANDDVLQTQLFVVKHWKRTHDLHAGQRSVPASKLIVIVDNEE